MIVLKWPVVTAVGWGSYSLLNFRGLYFEAKGFKGFFFNFHQRKEQILL